MYFLCFLHISACLPYQTGGRAPACPTKRAGGRAGTCLPYQTGGRAPACPTKRAGTQPPKCKGKSPSRFEFKFEPLVPVRT